MKKLDLRLPDYLNHIAQAIERFKTYTKGIVKDVWLGSTLIQDAVILNRETGQPALCVFPA
jgi:uncharacterized protein with HEPN domain